MADPVVTRERGAPYAITSVNGERRFKELCTSNHHFAHVLGRTLTRFTPCWPDRIRPEEP